MIFRSTGELLSQWDTTPMLLNVHNIGLILQIQPEPVFKIKKKTRHALSFFSGQVNQEFYYPRVAVTRLSNLCLGLDIVVMVGYNLSRIKPSCRNPCLIE